MKILQLTTLLLITFAQTSFGQTWQDTLVNIDKAFVVYQETHPGCQLSISRNGQMIYTKAWGLANLEQNTKLGTHSIFEAGSVSKQFTAAAILLLEQQGKLSLDDDVRKYIPELPDYGHVIRLRNLLHHTSGIRNWERMASLTGWPRGRKFYTNEDVLDIIIHQTTLNFVPGTEMLYSNSNYNLLALIVQRVSGRSLAQFTNEFIFVPAGMTHTQWRDDPNTIVPNRATAYEKEGDAYHTNMPNEYVYGHGGLLTTTDDLLKWCNFYQGNPWLYASLTKTDPLSNGTMNPYAAGLFIRKERGWKSISHDGATASYRAWLQTFPELRLSFAILSNTSEFNIGQVAHKITAIFVPDTNTASAGASKEPAGAGTEKTQAAIPTESELTAYAGLYLNERDGSTFDLSVKDHQLFLYQTIALIPKASHIFSGGNFQLAMIGNKGLVIYDSPKDSIPFRKVEQVRINKADMGQYAGVYYSTETNSSFTALADSGKLVIHLKPGLDYPLIPTYKDAFTLEELGAYIHYIRNASNQITGLTISFWDARDLKFKKR